MRLVDLAPWLSDGIGVNCCPADIVPNEITAAVKAESELKAYLR